MRAQAYRYSQGLGFRSLESRDHMVNHMSTYLYDVLERLIAFDTVSSHSDVPAMEHLAGHMERHGFKAMLHRTEIAGVLQANLVAWAGPPRPDGVPNE